MVSVRLDDEQRVIAYAVVIAGVNPFEDGVLISEDTSFFDEHFGVREMFHQDGSVVLGDEINNEAVPDDKDRLEALEQAMIMLMME